MTVDYMDSASSLHLLNDLDDAGIRANLSTLLADKNLMWKESEHKILG